MMAAAAWRVRPLPLAPLTRTVRYRANEIEVPVSPAFNNSFLLMLIKCNNVVISGHRLKSGSERVYGFHYCERPSQATGIYSNGNGEGHLRRHSARYNSGGGSSVTLRLRPLHGSPQMQEGIRRRRTAPPLGRVCDHRTADARSASRAPTACCRDRPRVIAPHVRTLCAAARARRGCAREFRISDLNTL